MARGLDRGGRKEVIPPRFDVAILNDLRARGYPDRILGAAIQAACATFDVPEADSRDLEHATVDAINAVAPVAPIVLDALSPLSGRQNGDIAYKLANSSPSLSLAAIFRRVPMEVKSAQDSADARARDQILSHITDDTSRRDVRTAINACLNTRDPLAAFRTVTTATPPAGPLHTLSTTAPAEYAEVEREFTEYVDPGTVGELSRRDAEVLAHLESKVSGTPAADAADSPEIDLPRRPSRLVPPTRIPGSAPDAFRSAEMRLSDAVRNQVAQDMELLEAIPGGYGEGVAAAAFYKYLRERENPPSEDLVREAINILSVSPPTRSPGLGARGVDAVDRLGVGLMPPPRTLERLVRAAAKKVDERISDEIVAWPEFRDKLTTLPIDISGTAARGEPAERLPTILQRAVQRVMELNDMEDGRQVAIDLRSILSQTRFPPRLINDNALIATVARRIMEFAGPDSIVRPRDIIAELTGDASHTAEPDFRSLASRAGTRVAEGVRGLRGERTPPTLWERDPSSLSDAELDAAIRGLKAELGE